MPTIKIKTVYFDKLKELDVYDQWLSNMKESDTRYDIIYCAMSFSQFISVSFDWQYSKEGDAFWYDISKK